MSVISGEPANISGSAPATSATARRFRSPTICVANRFSMRWAFPITPTTGLLIAPTFNIPISGKIVCIGLIPGGSCLPTDAGSTFYATLQACRNAGCGASGPAGGRAYFRVKASLGSMASTPGNPAARSALAGGIARPVQPRQFGLDPARHGLAERAAEIERPRAVRHHLGRHAVEAKSLAQRGLHIVRRAPAAPSRDLWDRRRSRAPGSTRPSPARRRSSGSSR